MTTRPNRPSGVGWLPWSGFGLSVLAIVFQAGQLSSELQRQGERIATLEASDKSRTSVIEAINIRGAIMDERGKRIEAKLDGAIDVPHRGGTR